ncbi:alpha/beta hydrolase [Rhizobium leguminosarum]|nr:alpha/beta hydrolase [Rhizobium leguminosarum]
MTISPLTIFGLHCIRKANPDFMVVFIHGILSNSEIAWGEPSWPELVEREAELANASIYVFTYRTGATSHTYGISDVADILLEHLRLNGLRDLRTLVLVCHSMGGIVARRLLVANSDEFATSKITVGLFLVASPSIGSRHANLISVLSYAFKHNQFAALRFSQSNEWLNDLNGDFKSLLAGRKLRIEGRELIEDRSIALKRWFGLWRQIVEPFSAAQYFTKLGCEPLKIPGSDHFSIAKPQSREEIQHRVLMNFITNFVLQDDGEPPPGAQAERSTKLVMRPHQVVKKAERARK